MRRIRTLLTCFAIIAALPGVSKADVIEGTASLSVGALYGTTNYSDALSPTTFIEGPTQFSGALASTNGKWYTTELPGPNLGQGSPALPTAADPATVWAQAPFSLTITLDGASGVNPTITITGTIHGTFNSEPLTLETAQPGLLTNVTMGFSATPTNVTLQGWTPSTGIPDSLINQLLNLSNYSIFTNGYDINSPTTPEFGAALEFIPAIEAEAPEPATFLLYLGAIAGLAARRATCVRRSKAQL
jgi:hypothetical protein